LGVGPSFKFTQNQNFPHFNEFSRISLSDLNSSAARFIPDGNFR
jgi:hypothetical protein